MGCCVVLRCYLLRSLLVLEGYALICCEAILLYRRLCGVIRYLGDSLCGCLLWCCGRALIAPKYAVIIAEAHSHHHYGRHDSYATNKS